MNGANKVFNQDNNGRRNGFFAHMAQAVALAAAMLALAPAPAHAAEREAAATAAAGATAAETAPTTVLVRLDGETITQADLSAYLDRFLDQRATARNASGVHAVLTDMAMMRALILEGSRIGVPKAGGDAPERFDAAYSLAVLRKLLPACEKPADVIATRQYFDGNPEAFRIPAAVRLTRVMLPVDARLEDKPAMGWLFEQAQAVASGQKKMEQVARQAATVYILDPQGDLGWVNLEGDNTIMQALGSAQSGDLVGPVRDGDFGYLFLVTGKRESRQAAWNEVAATAATRAEQYCKQKSREDLRASLFERHGVKIDAAAVKALFKTPS
ncbi:MAG: peptidyl-prolyl cis-trans isomerase [Burkholderiaceae bacterium]|jgi:hypothetical protein|nr:peptidyl-prolyl cis-trans isomerase [Burkholderiaceae bacterium]